MSTPSISALSRRLLNASGLSNHFSHWPMGGTTRLGATYGPRAYSSNAAPFTYRLAASAAGKRTPPRPPIANRDFWLYSSVNQSQETPFVKSTKPNAGEDAFFLTTVGQSPHSVAFGVADGVGGWTESGVDPSKFSHGICEVMGSTAYGWKEEKACKPKELMQTGYDAIMNNPRIAAGGCTASLGVLDGEGRLEAANLGDSGFLIFGPGKVTYRSEPQTHAFNTPYQLSKVPKQMRAQEAIFGGSSHFSETPAQADVSSHKLRHGDVVLFATDGVWDNLSAQDTLAIVTRVMKEQGAWFMSHNFPGAETMLNEHLFRNLAGTITEEIQDRYLPGLIATAVMREAKVAGLDRRRNGPFAKEVKARYPNEPWEGGKPDDVAVVVAIAVENAVEEQGKEKPLKAKL